MEEDESVVGPAEVLKIIILFGETWASRFLNKTSILYCKDRLLEGGSSLAALSSSPTSEAFD